MEVDLRQAALRFDIKRLDASFLADPFPLYRALREHDPVHRMPDGSYFLSRYDDCAAIYRDPETWSSDKKVDFKPNFGDSSLFEHHTTSLVFNDPPYHSRVRKLLAAAFTLQLIGDMLGIPDDERGPLREWSLAILSALEPVLSSAQLERGTQAVDEFKAYLRRLIARRPRSSRDEGEILSKLIAASDLSTARTSGERLTELELLHNCIF